MKRVSINELTEAVYEDYRGEYILLTEEEWDNVAKHFTHVHNQINNLQQQLELLNKTVRNVCFDTENPFYTK